MIWRWINTYEYTFLGGYASIDPSYSEVKAKGLHGVRPIFKHTQTEDSCLYTYFIYPSIACGKNHHVQSQMMVKLSHPMPWLFSEFAGSGILLAGGSWEPLPGQEDAWRCASKYWAGWAFRILQDVNRQKNVTLYDRYFRYVNNFLHYPTLIYVCI